MDGNGVDNGESGIGSSRSRRTRQDKSGRLEALEKLKNLRGSKNKYEVKQMENVYDTVDESTYCRTVQSRQKDDWIVDDGSGYVEDGREIFDDDLVEDDDDSNYRRKPKSKKEKEERKQEKDSQRANFNSLRDMLSSMPVKRKRPDDNGSSQSSASKSGVTEDDLLGDLFMELHEEKKPRINAPQNTRLAENTRNAESFIQESKIRKEEKVAFSSPKGIVMKKKFTQYKVPEPRTMLEEYDNGIEEIPSYNDCHSEDTPVAASPRTSATTEKMQGLKIKVEPGLSEEELAPKPIKPVIKVESVESNFEEIENFETYGELVDDSKDLSGLTCSNDKSTFMVGGDSEENRVLNFFWLDMFEEHRSPGCLYLFGKVQLAKNVFQSCCVVVKDLKRCVYVLPREAEDQEDPVSLLDVYNEFNDSVCPKYKISNFLSKKSERKYCFGQPGVPRLSEYLEVRYAGSMPQLPSDLTGKTFSKVFGTNSPLMENFLLEKKLKGPSWLLISSPEPVDSSQQQSWCKHEFNCEVRDIEINADSSKTPPPIVLVSLNIQAVNDANTKKDTIVFVGVAVNNQFPLQSALSSSGGIYHDYFCFVNKPPGEIWPLDVDRVMNRRTIKMESERAMLGCLLAKLQQIDADAYLGHDLNFELLLLHLFNYKVPHWSRVGRLKRTTLLAKQTGKTLDYRAALAGRLLCDVKISAMELIRARSYDQSSLASQVLGMKDEQVSSKTGAEIKALYDSSEGLRHLVNWGMQHCVLNIRLVNELQVMPLALQITNIAGNTLCRTLLGGRSERNEFLLLHAFHSKNYIVPDKFKPFMKKGLQSDENVVDAAEVDGKKSGGKKNSGPSYLGGLVLEPKKGFYDNFIVLMDFNSLYPSIIQEYNICFTTTLCPEDSGSEDTNKGILPEEIRKLVETRRLVKSLMKKSDVSADLMRQYDIRQKALKLTANSMYGCLGFRQSRFYAQELAAMITGKGREILLKTKDAVESMGFEVIYGDTDSLMINTNVQDIQKVYQIGNKIKTEINRMYKLLELEIDGVFRFLLLLKKKKYAALVYTPKPDEEGGDTSLELKGLDMVRRDWAPVAANTAREVLDEVMTEQALDDKIFKICKILNDASTKLRTGNLPMKELLITKQLAKHPEEYKSSQGLHHVTVALRMNALGNLPKKFRNGDTVSYLFCTDGLPHHLSELTRKPIKQAAPTEESTEEAPAKVEEELKPDPQYYLAHQVHPVVSRICDPIPGLDPAKIAEELGMDPTSFKRQRVIQESHDDKLLGSQTEAEKYKDCERFSFRCTNRECHEEISIEAPFSVSGSEVAYALGKCTKCLSSTFPTLNHICNSLTLFIRKFILKYYLNVYICEDPSCDNKDRTVPLRLDIKGFPVCSCKDALMFKEYRDIQLYKQLTYLRYVFDFDKHLAELNPADQAIVQIARKTEEAQRVESDLARLNEVVTRFLNSSGYSEIKLGHLFQDLYPK